MGTENLFINTNRKFLLSIIWFLWIIVSADAQHMYTITFDKSGKIVSDLPDMFVDRDALIFKVIGYKFTPSVKDSIVTILKKNIAKKSKSAVILNLFNINTSNIDIVPDAVETHEDIPAVEYKIQIDGIKDTGKAIIDNTYILNIKDTLYIYHNKYFNSLGRISAKKRPDSSSISYYQNWHHKLKFPYITFSWTSWTAKKVAFISDDNKIRFTLIKENNFNDTLIAYYKRHLEDWDSTSTKLDTATLTNSLKMARKVADTLNKYNEDMAKFYEIYRIPELTSLADHIRNSPAYHPEKLTKWINDWMWYTGVPALNPFSFHNPKDFKNVDTSQVPAMRIKLAAINRKIMRLGGNYYDENLKIKYDSLYRIIDTLELNITRITSAYSQQTKSQARNKQDLKDFVTTKTILNNAFLYCTSTNYKNGYRTPIYWMRNHDAANNTLLMNDAGKDEYLETDKVMFLGQNLTANQNLVLNISVTPISGQGTFWGDGVNSLLGTTAIQTSNVQFNARTARTESVPEDSLEILRKDSAELYSHIKSLIYDPADFNKKVGALNKTIDSLRYLLHIIQTPGYTDTINHIYEAWERIKSKIDNFNTTNKSYKYGKDDIDILLSIKRTTDLAIQNDSSYQHLKSSISALEGEDNSITRNVESKPYFQSLKSLKNSVSSFQDEVNSEVAKANQILKDIQTITGLTVYIKFIQSQHTPYTNLPAGKVDTVYHTSLINSSVIATVATPNTVSYSFVSTSTTIPPADTSTSTKKTTQSGNNTPPANNAKPMPTISNAYKLDKLYRVLPFAGFAYCTRQFINLALNSTGTAPAKLTLVNPVSTVVGLKFYLQKTDIRSDKFLIGAADGRCLFLSRTSIDIGVGIPNPINNLYCGLGLDIIPGINLTGGILIQGYPLYNFLNTQYAIETDTYRSGLYFGVSTDPAVVMQLAKLLNLSK